MRKLVLITLSVALAAAAVSGCSSKGKTREPTALKDIANPVVRPYQLWSVDAGKGGGKFFSELRPALSAEGLYLADIKGRVFAYDPASGKSLWRTDVKGEIIAGPVVADTALLFGTLQGDIIALKREDGSELWRAALSSEALGPPTAKGEIIVARSGDGVIYGLAASDGHRLWTFDRSVPALALRGSSAPLIVGDSVVVGLDNGRLVSLRLVDGQPQWETAVSTPSGRTELDRLADVDADILVAEKCLYVASFGGEVACIDKERGEVLWRRGVKSYNSMVLANGKLFVSDEAGVVWALDPETGAANWKQDGLQYRKLSPPLVLDGFVAVGDYQGYLHWLDPADGHLVGRNRIGSDGIAAQPVVVGESAYVLGRTGRLDALTLKHEGRRGLFGG